MGEKSVTKLVFETRRLNKLGDSIRHVPPLQFVGFVLTDGHLTNCLRKMKKSYFKWSTFMNGFSDNMDREFAEGRLQQDLPGFAELVGANKAVLEGYANKHAWENFVVCML